MKPAKHRHAPPEPPPLWTCPRCGRRFANRNQTHTCSNYTLEHHFDGKSAEVRELFDAFLRILERFGPVTVLPEKTRIAFQVRMSFAQVSVRKSYLVGHLVLARAIEDRRFFKVQTYSPRNHTHHFRLSSIDELDKGFAKFAGEAYAVGEQKHLRRKGRG
jgi:hypothetical protein